MSKTTDILNEIKQLDLSKYPYFQAQELIRSLGKTNFLVFTLHRGTVITRARPGANYLFKSEISYPPKENCTECQRANIPNKSVFYGTIVQEEQPLEDTRMIAASECCDLLREGIETTGIRSITFGRWLVVKDINLIAIVAEKNFNNVSNNPLLAEIKEAFNSMHTSKEEIEKTKLIISYFSDEFSKGEIKNNYEYLISALFSEIVSYELGYDGVMYPSVQIGGQLGFNVAIKPETVDKNLKLDIVAESTVYKKKDKSLLLVDKISDMAKWSYIDSPQATLNVICEKLEISSLTELKSEYI